MWPFNEAHLLEVKYNAIISKNVLEIKVNFVVTNLPEID